MSSSGEDSNGYLSRPGIPHRDGSSCRSPLQSVAVRDRFAGTKTGLGRSSVNPARVS